MTDEVNLMSPHGTVVKFTDGKALRYFCKRSPQEWTQITNAQYEKAIEAQTAHRERRRNEQLADLLEDDEDGPPTALRGRAATGAASGAKEKDDKD